MGKSTKLVNIIRKSTPNQSIAAQQKYHAGKITKIFTGSAYKAGQNPVFKYIKTKFNKGISRLVVNLFSADRFSRNVQECYDLRDWLQINKKSLIIIANRKRYDFCEDFLQFVNLITDPEAQSRAISEKSKKIWQERRRNPQIKKKIILNDVEKYFVRQIIFTRDENGNYLSINMLYENLRSCGIANFSKENISKWREELTPVEEDHVHSLKCSETDLRFAHPKGEHDIDSDIPLWKKYKRFISFPEFATNLAQNFPYLNAIWEEEIGLENMEDLDNALDDLIEDTVIDNEEIMEDAAPASDILQKIKEAYEMMQAGIISEEEFIAIKAKFI